jgi:gamma-glutamylcyclotransferase (GGCT)/AIG2-like uncharacterized protein YtfP
VTGAPSLFVYGTLRSEFHNEFACLLRAGSVFMGKARVRGRLYRLGGYPGLKLSKSGEHWARGEVYLLRDPEATLRALDAYEGCAPDDPRPHQFERVKTGAVMEDGSVAEVWVYAYNREVPESRRIVSGDFLAGVARTPSFGLRNHTRQPRP